MTVTQLTNEAFRNVRVKSSVSHFRIERCTIEACSLGVPRDAVDRLVASDCELIDSKVQGGGIRGVHLRDATVRNVRLSSMPQILGCVFERVTLAGKVNQLMIRAELPTVDHPRAFEDSARVAYQNIDWAIDISDLDCPDLSIQGVPGDLIRRDSERQVVVTRERATQAPWRDADLNDTNFSVAIDQMLRLGWSEVVLSAARSGPHKARAHAAIHQLIALGVTDG